MNRFLARAYPAIAAVAQVMIMAMTAMNTVLIIQRTAAGTVTPIFPTRGAVRRENSSWMFRMVKTLGHHWGVGELMAAGGLNMPVMIQYRGKMNRNARMISITKEKIL